MEKEEFFRLLEEEVKTYNSILETSDGDWIVKGFIDIYKNIYVITNDTKVVSKIIEIILIPHLQAFAEKNDLSFELPNAQNFYPDATFKDADGNLFAVDFKTTYTNGGDRINPMTLGAFSGYFRDRESTKNIQHPYKEYKSHLVLGVLYKQAETKSDEKKFYNLNDIQTIKSVINSFTFFVQPKYKIASDVPGSGNTKNIGAVTDVNKILNGQGVFADLGEEIFDDYWMNYMNAKDAKEQGLSKPNYNNITTYKEYLATKIELGKKIKNE